MNIDEKIQQALNAPDDCGYARLAKDLARFLQESRAAAVTSAVNGIDMSIDQALALEQWITDSREAINRSLE